MEKIQTSKVTLRILPSIAADIGSKEIICRCSESDRGEDLGNKGFTVVQK